MQFQYIVPLFFVLGGCLAELNSTTSLRGANKSGAMHGDIARTLSERPPVTHDNSSGLGGSLASMTSVSNETVVSADALNVRCFTTPHPSLGAPFSHVCYNIHAYLNCYSGHGAYEIDHDDVPNVHSLQACAELCSETSGCEGFTFMYSQQKCWRRSHIDTFSCEHGIWGHESEEFDTFARVGSSACQDLPGATSGHTWSDGRFGCTDYGAHPDWCEMYGATDFNGEGRANSNCCACGGGSSAIQPGTDVPSTPTSTPQAQCDANADSGHCIADGAWADESGCVSRAQKYGDVAWIDCVPGCAWVNWAWKTESGCATAVDTRWHAVPGTGVPSTSTGPASSICHDLTGAVSRQTWSDGFNGCNEYAVNGDWCAKFGATDYNGQGAANDICCTCGGGSSRTQHVTLAPVTTTAAPATTTTIAGVHIAWGQDVSYCLSSQGDNIAEGEKVQLWQCDQTWHSGGQSFHFDEYGRIVMSQDPRFCLVIGGGNFANGASIQLGWCGEYTHPNQIWNLENSGQIRATNSPTPMCVAINLNHAFNGAIIQLWSCSLTNAQDWTRLGLHLPAR